MNKIIDIIAEFKQSSCRLLGQGTSNWSILATVALSFGLGLKYNILLRLLSIHSQTKLFITYQARCKTSC